MHIFKYSILLIVIALLGFGCAKKQEDAAQLEAEMMAQDSMADTTEVLDSTVEAASPEAAVPEEPVVSMPAQPPGEGYTVQVASCTDYDYANYLVDKFTGRGYEPYVKTITYEGETYYRVRIGVYENFSEAKAMVAELADKYTLETWIDVTQPAF